MVIQAPAPGTYGSTTPTTAAQGFQQASAGGPTFGSGGPPAGTIFALNQTALVSSGVENAPETVIAPDTATMAAGATITVADPAAGTVRLTIPNLNVDIVLKTNGDLEDQNGNTIQFVYDSTLNYTVLGRWQVGPPNVGDWRQVGEFVIGYQTPSASMPASGTASYSLKGGVHAWVDLPTPSFTASEHPSSYTFAAAIGDANLSVDFGKGTVTGSFTNMQITSFNSPGSVVSEPWNNVSLSATISGASFSGSTSASAASGQLSLSSSATGTIRGGFYGPSADEVGAVWTLYDGSRAAIGTVGASKTAPSDSRLKRDARWVGELPGGLALYRYRYLCDEREFIGVMAQDLLTDDRYRDAVVEGEGGYYWVDYGRLGFAPADLDAMVAAGRRATRSLATGRT